MWRKLDEVSDSWNHRRIVAPFLDGEKTFGLENNIWLQQNTQKK